MHQASASNAPATARDPAATGMWLLAGVNRVERNARPILLAMMGAYVLVFFVLAYLKYANYGQGYDQVDFEQAIWNTTQGRPFEDSRFSYTESIFGLDWMPLLALFVPFYALLPSAHTLFFLQVLVLASGALPVYLLAQERIGTRRAGLVFAACWLLYPTVEWVTLSPFQVRAFAAVALLWALYFLEKGRLLPCLALVAVALAARTDVALVVPMLGVYELLGKRRPAFVIAPVVLGLGYFAVVMTLILPQFIHLQGVSCSGPVPISQISDKWPGGNNPNVGYYLHWGCTPGEIFVNLIKNPLYTLRYMVFGPPPEALQGVADTATFVAQGNRLPYLAALLAPLAFLGLLAPRALLLGLPILGLNLIAWRTAQVDYRTQYQILIMVGVMMAAIAGYKRLATWLGEWAGFGVAPALGGGLEARPDPDPAQVSRELRSLWVRQNGPLLALLFVALGANLWLVNPAWSVIKAAFDPQTAGRVAAADALVAQVPRDAPVAASSFLAPHLLPRRYIYNFPPAPYSPSFDRVQYVLVDPKASALASNLLPSGKTALQELVQDSGNFRLLDKRGDYELYQRVR